MVDSLHCSSILSHSKTTHLKMKISMTATMSCSHRQDLRALTLLTKNMTTSILSCQRQSLVAPAFAACSAQLLASQLATWMPVLVMHHRTLVSVRLIWRDLLTALRTSGFRLRRPQKHLYKELLWALRMLWHLCTRSLSLATTVCMSSAMPQITTSSP